MRSDDFKECDNCDFTSSTEAEEGGLEAKRRKITKKFEDCLTAPQQIQEPISEKQTRPPSQGGPSLQTRRSGSPVNQQSTKSQPTHGKRSPYPMPEAKFQRKVMEMLVEIREDIRTMKKERGGLEMQGDSRLPAQATTVEEINVLDKSLNCLEEKQRLINSLSNVGGIHLKDNVKRVMEKLMTNELMASFNMKGGKGKLAFTKLHLYNVVTGKKQNSNHIVAFCLISFTFQNCNLGVRYLKIAYHDRS
ncbi:uncharacterized protein LOC143718362 [Siphateles boraxobius]|uniref:uncharacterized protein LOC143718362 n=1 Tax=Siphateles boraxobius TaxID=180520 RepID=UPI004062ED73